MIERRARAGRGWRKGVGRCQSSPDGRKQPRARPRRSCLRCNRVERKHRRSPERGYKRRAWAGAGAARCRAQRRRRHKLRGIPRQPEFASQTALQLANLPDDGAVTLRPAQKRNKAGSLFSSTNRAKRLHVGTIRCSRQLLPHVPIACLRLCADLFRPHKHPLLAPRGSAASVSGTSDVAPSGTPIFRSDPITGAPSRARRPTVR